MARIARIIVAITKLFFKSVSLVLIVALVSNGAFAEERERDSAMIDVAGGIIEVGGEEIFVTPFSVSREAEINNEPDAPDCENPSIPEYLMAAKVPGFKVSHAFEILQPPADDTCSWSRDVLEAEGVEGNIYFAGIGNHRPDELTFVYGGSNPRDSISKIHSNVFTFWGDEYKPSPRGSRCIYRRESSFRTATVHKELVLVKDRRSERSRTKMTLTRGTPVTIIHLGTDWSFIKAQGRHPCQPDPEWTTFEDSGWILTKEVAIGAAEGR